MHSHIHARTHTQYLLLSRVVHTPHTARTHTHTILTVDARGAYTSHCTHTCTHTHTHHTYCCRAWCIHLILHAYLHSHIYTHTHHTYCCHKWCIHLILHAYLALTHIHTPYLLLSRVVHTSHTARIPALTHTHTHTHTILTVVARGAGRIIHVASCSTVAPSVGRKKTHEIQVVGKLRWDNGNGENKNDRKT